jgi:hypothetical protein
MTDQIQPQLHYHGELMKNYAYQVPVGAGNDFRTLMDRTSHPLIFAIGSDHQLRLISRNDAGSADKTDKTEIPPACAPWQLTSLTADLVHAFAIAQNPDSGEIRVAYCTFDGKRSRLFYSSPGDNDFASLKSSGLAWQEHPLDDPADEVNKIEIDFEHVMFSTRHGDHQAFYYAASFGGPNAKFTLPENTNEIVDFKVGSYPRGIRGTYLLYDVGAGQTLLFQGFPDQDGEITEKSFSTKGPDNAPCRLNAIDLIRKKGGNDQLLACGDVVFLYQSDRERLTLVEKRNGSTFHGLQASQYDGSSSIWVTEKTPDQRSRLLFLTDCFFDETTQKVDAGKWTSDLPLVADVRQFSCIKGSATGNHLILVDAHEQLSHFYQDPSTTLWRQDAIVAESPEELLEFSCYTTRLILSDQDGTPVEPRPCYISASSEVSATINGAAYRLGSEHPVLVKTDAMGALTIINQVDELDVPIFYVGFEENQRSYFLNPAHNVEERLSKIKTGKDFEEALTDAGSLWDPQGPPSRRDLDEAATIIGQLLDCKRKMLEDEIAKWPGARAGNPYPPPDPWSAKSNTDLWGVQFDNGTVKYLDGKEAQEVLDKDAAGKGVHPIRWIGHTIGSLIHSVKSLFGELRSFIVRKVNDVTRFILNIAGELFEFVIDTLEKVFPFLKAVFDALGLVFKTLLHWLGRLLGWNDIWDTHKMIARFTRNGMKSIAAHAQGAVKEWKRSAHASIAKLKESVNPDDLPEERKKNPITRWLVSPLFTWPMYMLQHGMWRIPYNVTIGQMNELDHRLQEQAQAYGYVSGMVQDELRAIVAFATSPSFSSEDLLKLFRPILDRILETVDQLIGMVGGLLDFAAEVVGQMEKLFDADAAIPFVGPIYEFLTKLCGEKEDFNFLNGLSLIIAIPFTTYYKSVIGGKPFESVSDGFGEPEMFEEIWAAAPQNAPLAGRTDSGVPESPSESDRRIHEYQSVGGEIGSFFGMLNGFLAFGSGNKVVDKIGMVLNILTHAATIPVVTAAGLQSDDDRAAYGLRWTQFVMSWAPAYVLPSRPVAKRPIPAMILSITSLGTNVAANVLSSPGTLSWIGQMMSRAGSLVSGAGAFTDKNPYVLSAGVGLDLGGGLLSLTSASVGLGKDLNHGTFV